MSKAMQRAQRTARAVQEGARIFTYLTKAETRRLLIAAAEAGHPPVAAVSAGLITEVGHDALKGHVAKQFAGLCIRAVLEEEGFTVLRTGVRLSRDTVFRTGSIYQKAAPAAMKDGHELLLRFLDTLTLEEARFVVGALAERLRRSQAADDDECAVGTLVRPMMPD